MLFWRYFASHFPLVPLLSTVCFYFELPCVQISVLSLPEQSKFAFDATREGTMYNTVKLVVSNWFVRYQTLPLTQTLLCWWAALENLLAKGITESKHTRGETRTDSRQSVFVNESVTHLAPSLSSRMRGHDEGNMSSIPAHTKRLLVLIENRRQYTPHCEDDDWNNNHRVRHVRMGNRSHPLLHWVQQYSHNKHKPLFYEASFHSFLSTVKKWTWSERDINEHLLTTI